MHLVLLQNYVTDKREYIYHHAVSTGLIAGYIAKRMKFKKGERIQVALAGCLSDCGMARVNPLILQQSHIGQKDLKEIKLHPANSYKMVKDIPSLSLAAKMGILQHHERLDGSGYPFKEKGDRIHLYARIIAVADVYHALTCDRIYKTKVSPIKALDIMLYEMFGQLDIPILQKLSGCITPLTINMMVKLSSGRSGKILYVDQKNPVKTIVQLMDTDEIIDLSKEKHLYINEIL